MLDIAIIFYNLLYWLRSRTVPRGPNPSPKKWFFWSVESHLCPHSCQQRLCRGRLCCEDWDTSAIATWSPSPNCGWTHALTSRFSSWICKGTSLLWVSPDDGRISTTHVHCSQVWEDVDPWLNCNRQQQLSRTSYAVLGQVSLKWAGQSDCQKDIRKWR